MKIAVTGGAGFIGSAVARFLVHETEHDIVVLDKLTYAGHRANLGDAIQSPRLTLLVADICDPHAVATLFSDHRPDAVMHLAAESHVDRSIDGPAAFIDTNIVGTYTLLEAARTYWQSLPGAARDAFRFHHISTDEVYGELGETGQFTEQTPYQPSSPYSASKAASDHLVRAWHRTYGLPVLVTNCSNNYGPYHYPEKLIPLTILNALDGKPLPVYGDGAQVRDWLFVEDHAQALYTVIHDGRVGETYNVGGGCERRNIEVVQTICDLLEILAPDKPAWLTTYRDLITYVTDRPGHDRRYAINTSKIQRELGWKPRESFASGLRKTVQWYLENRDWCRLVLRDNVTRERIGLVGGTTTGNEP